MIPRPLGPCAQEADSRTPRPSRTRPLPQPARVRWPAAPRGRRAQTPAAPRGRPSRCRHRAVNGPHSPHRLTIGPIRGRVYGTSHNGALSGSRRMPARYLPYERHSCRSTSARRTPRTRASSHSPIQPRHERDRRFIPLQRAGPAYAVELTIVLIGGERRPTKVSHSAAYVATTRRPSACRDQCPQR